MSLQPFTYMAMVMEKLGGPLVQKNIPLPIPQAGQVLIRIIACGVCRTDLHVLEGDLKEPKLPLVLGHEIIGQVVSLGPGASKRQVGQWVGVPWLAHSCGECKYCRQGRENLCENALFTGYTVDGGYAEYTLAYEDFCFPIASALASPQGAPLLCAGLIGYRSYQMIDPGAEHLGLYGFGAAAHLLIQAAIYQGKKVYAFTRDGDYQTQAFARKLGATWAGDASDPPPVKLDGAIIFAPAGELVPKALGALDKGGTLVCGGIHMSDIPSFAYELLWEERILRSVANLTRDDAKNYLALASAIPVRAEIETFSLFQANEALAAFKAGRVHGAAVLLMN